MNNEWTDFVGPISIGDSSVVGMNTILMGGVSLPKQCIVGAGSIVTKSFTEEGCVIAGNPARRIGSLYENISLLKNYAFNFKGMNYDEKKMEILSHPEKYRIK